MSRETPSGTALLTEVANLAAAELDLSRALNARMTVALERLAYLDPARNAFDTIAETVRAGLDCHWANVGRLIPGTGIIELVGVAGGKPAVHGMRYPLVGTPCEHAWSLADPVVVIGHNVASHFPQAPILAALGAQSYRGAGLLTPAGELLGIIVAIDDHPCGDNPAERALLRTAAARATLELQRIATERERIDQEQRLAAALAISNLGLLEWHVRDDRMTVDSRFAEILGWTPEEFGLNRAAWVARVHPEDFSRIASLLDQLLQAGSTPATCEYRLLTRAGNWHWVRVQAHVIERDENGDALRLLGVYADIHEQRLAEQALRDKESHLALAIESAGLAEILWDVTSDRFDVNPVWSRLLGYEPGEIPPTAAAWAALAHPDDYPASRQNILDFLRDGTFGTPLPHRVKAKDGSWRYVQMGGRVVERDAEGRATRAHGLFMDVHAAHEAAELLRERTEFLELAVRGSMDGLWDWRYVSDELYLSPRLGELLGHSIDEMPSLRRDFVARYGHPDDKALQVELVRQLRNGGGNMNFDFRLRTRNDEWRWFHCRGTTLHDGDGQPVRVVGSISDITERKQREAELAQAREQLRDAIEHIDAGIVMSDANDRLVLSNQRYGEMYGYAPEMLQPGTPLQVLTRDLHLRYPDYLAGRDLEQAIKERLAIHRERRGNWEMKLGEHWFRIGDFPTASGGTVSLRTDITAIKHTEKALRESEARLRTVLDNSPVGIFFNAPDGRLVFANATYLKTVRLTAEQASGFAWESHVHLEDRARVVQHWREFCAAPQNLMEVEYRTQDENGPERLLLARAAPITENAQLLGFAGTIEDITDRRADEIERLRLQAQIQQAQKMEAIGQLTGGIAHDFNNILASMLGFTHLARRVSTAYDNPKLDEYLAAVEQGGERARDLVSKMLAFSRHTPGQEQHCASPQRLIDEAVQFLQPMIPAGIRIAMQLDPGAGDVLVDAVDLHQALVNLAVNARDAIGEHGHITIRLHGARHRQARCASCTADFSGEFVEVALSDNGSGIRPEHVAHLFEPFFSTKDVGKGTGMGLAVTHGVVHRAQGHILIETAPGTGTTVKLLLRPAPFAASEAPAPVRETTTTRDVRGTILLVDDEPSITRMLGTMLEGQGYQVAAFNDTQVALDWAASHGDTFDALITDQTMPGMSGFDLARRLLGIRPDLPILLCTGYSDVVDEAVCLAAGIRHFMHKPVPFEYLLDVLAGALEDASVEPT